MKKFVVIVLAVLMVLGLTGAAMADGFVAAPGEVLEGHTAPCGVGAYVKMSRPFDYSCNGQKMICPCQSVVWVPFTVKASVAQWLLLKVNYTKIEWRVLKPGTYRLPEYITVKVKSNGNLIVHAKGFDHLRSVAGEPDVIDTYYKIDACGHSTGWIPAPDLNCKPLFIPEDQKHNWYEGTVDVKIVVEECDSACGFINRGCVRVMLAEQKPWMKEYLN
ncbi:hypothetical protein J7K42_01295 [bacterium]|nr:hypothetical protein [bacterium]